MTWTTARTKPVYPPLFVPYEPDPEGPSLDDRLAHEKERKKPWLQMKTSSVDNTPLKRSLLQSPFRKHSNNNSFHQAVQQRNHQLVACRLPQNVYATIFVECARLPLEDLVGWSWLTVLQVCQKWRSAALRSRKLWGFIDFSSPKRTMAFFDRAKGEPLSVRAIVGQHNVPQLKSILSLARQIKCIEMHSSAENISPLLETLACPYPTATSLVVNVTSSKEPLAFYPRPNFPLFSQEEHTKLLTAHLQAAPLYLLSYRCPVLTHLTLRDLPTSETQSQLHQLLSNLPQLRHLTLSNCSMRGKAPVSPILLRNLQLLAVEGSLQQVADFLGVIGLSPFCRLSCVIKQVDNLTDSLWRFCQYIGTHSYSSAQETPLEAVSLTGNEVDSRYTPSYEPNPDFRQLVRIRASGDDAKRGSTVFDISIGSNAFSLCDEVLVLILTGIWRALFLTGVKTLSLYNVDIITQKTWTQFLRTLPQLRVLDIKGYAPSGLLWALLLDVISPSDGGPRFLATHLNDIYLHGVDCSSGGFMLSSKGQTNSHVDVDDSSFLNVLVAVLKYRRENQMGIRSLTVTRCERVAESSFDDIKSLVSHLVWDIRGKTTDATIRYRNMVVDSPRSDLRHYDRLEALLS